MHLCTGGSELCAPGTAADTDSETDSKPVCALISVLYSVCNPVGHDSAGDILRYVEPTRRNCRTHSCRTDCVVFLEPFSVGSRRFHRCPDRADAGVRLFGISNGLSTGRLLCNQSSRIANQHEMKCFVHNILLTIF